MLSVLSFTQTIYRQRQKQRNQLGDNCINQVRGGGDLGRVGSNGSGNRF